MKISQLRLTHFRSHKQTSFDLDRVTIIRGPNGAGKSSIQDALEFLFTGTTRQTDAAGRGADLLIALGAKELAVRAQLDFKHDDIDFDGGQLSRTRSHAGGSLMAEAPDFLDSNKVGKHAEAWIAEHIAPVPVLQAVLNSGRFLSLPEKEQKNLLTAALASKPAAVPKDIYDAIRACSQPVPDIAVTEVASVTQADAVHAFFYKLRTDLNREIKALGELTVPDIPADAPDAATVKAQLTDLHRERDTLLQSKIKRQTTHTADRLSLAEAQRQVEQFKADILPDDELERMRKVATKKDQVVRQQQIVQGIIEGIATARQKLTDLRNSPDLCPSCERPMDKEKQRNQVTHLEQVIATAEGVRDEEATRLRKMGEPETAQQRLDAHKKAVIATGSAERALKELANLPETCDVTDLEQKIATLGQRIAQGAEVLAEVQRLAGAQQQYAQAATKKQELANRVLAAEKIITAFGPGGPIRAQLVGDRLGEFTDKLRGVLSRFDFYCDLKLEPYKFSIFYDPARGWAGPSLRSIQLSESEAFRFSIAFQIALAEATGVNFVVIDRSDMLLPDLRSTLAETLLESKLDQAIVLVAGELNPITLPPDVKLYDLVKDQNGHTAIASEYKYCPRETVYEEIPQ